MITLPPMDGPQSASWHGVMDIHQQLPDGWTMVGGQMIHLYCAEYDVSPPRPTNDVDTVIDVRADPGMLMAFTRTLVRLGFSSAGVSPEGAQHRWTRDTGVIDVLLPDGVGERTAARPGTTGSPTLPTPGGTQALQRSRSVAVSAAGRRGFVRVPTWSARWS